MSKLQFRPGLLPSLATLILLALFIRLGVWQLDRANQKIELAGNLEARQSQPALAPLDLAERDELSYYNLKMTGSPKPDLALWVDNQIVEGRSGYFLLQLFQSDGLWLLVNRGWLPAPGDRTQLPELPAFSAVQVEGMLYQQLERPPFAAEIDAISKRGNNWVFPALDRPLMEEALAEIGYDIAPLTVRQTAPDEPQFQRRWEVFASGPEKHWGYAVQWFAFALALIILYLVLNTKRQTNDEASNP